MAETPAISITQAGAPVYKFREFVPPPAPVPLPKAAQDGAADNSDTVMRIVSGQFDVGYMPPQVDAQSKPPPGAHLDMLELGTKTHRKAKEGKYQQITTRAVWLEWETHKHLWLPPLTQPGQPEYLLGNLYMKKQGGPATGWKLRDFRADMVPGTLSYTAKKTNDKRVLWITRGCIIQRLDGKYEGRVGCIRILWPSGFDLILSTIDNEPSCSRWYEYLCALLSPADEYRARREALSSDLAYSLHRASIRSQKDNELTPYGMELSSLGQQQKMALRIRASFSDIFPLLQDASQFRELLAIKTEDERDASIEYLRWACSANPWNNYAELPDQHYATCPCTTEISAAWEALVDEFPDRHFEELRRFLVAASWDANKASTALKRHIEWRRNVLPLRPESFYAELSKGTCFVRGLDHAGHPVIYYFVEDRGAEQRRVEEQVQACLYRLEQAIARLPYRDGKVTVLVVFPRVVTTAVLYNQPLIKALSSTVAENYPERLHALLVYPSTANTALTLTRERANIGGDIFRRIILIPDEAALRCHISQENLISKVGGTDPYTFHSASAEARSPVLLPPLWVGEPSLLSDYYPPPRTRVSIEDPVPQQVFSQSEKEERFVCCYCSNRVEGDIGLSSVPGAENECALCRFATGMDDYYGGWQPLETALYPEPSMKNFLALAAELQRRG
jgi:CRAL/TRIO domain